MAEYFRRLYSLRDEIDVSIKHFRALPNLDQLLDDDGRQLINQRAEQLAQFFEPYGLSAALRATRRLQEQRNKLSPAEVIRALDDLWGDFLADCDGPACRSN